MTTINSWVIVAKRDPDILSCDIRGDSCMHVQRNTHIHVLNAEASNVRYEHFRILNMYPVE